MPGAKPLGKMFPARGEYKEILDRDDVDAVIIATMDHWHRPILEEACAAGKDIYCEKGPCLIPSRTASPWSRRRKTAGEWSKWASQRVSSVLYAKAREIYQSGKLGEVTTIEAYWDRKHGQRAPGFTRSRRIRAPRRSTGIAFSATPRSGPMILSASSAGDVTRITGKVWRATCSST